MRSGDSSVAAHVERRIGDVEVVVVS